MQAVRPVVRSVIARNGARRAYHAPGEHKPASISDLPSPQGSWQDAHNAAQRKYTVTLITGIAVFVGTIGALKSTDFNLHSSPPSSI